MKTRVLLLLLAVLLVLAACGPQGSDTLTVMTHDSFAVSEQVVRDFEQANGVKVVFLKSGDAGTALNKAILSKAAPLADVFFGVDNTFLSRALAAGIFESYDSPLLAQVPAEFILDPERRVLPVDYGDVCLNYDVSWFAERKLPLPGTLSDLVRPEYRDLLVVENPATSSPGLAFMLATLAEFGEEGFVDYWTALRDNGLKVVDGWESAYYGEFSGSSGRGPRPLVVSYASSPPAEVIYAEQPLSEAPTASLIADGMCFRQVEFAGILAGTRQRSLAEKWIDYMLDLPFQNDLPLQMFVFPVNRDAVLPSEFVKYALLPGRPAFLPPDDIAANRERWITLWVETVLR